MRVFVLIFGITGIYVSSVFIRLEIFASLSLIILASIGLSILTKEIFNINASKQKNYLIKSLFVVIIITLITIPLYIPENSNWIDNADQPPIILTGASSSPPTNDWLDALEWIKTNTPENAVIASWWDYGYWITTLSDRTTLVDNATLGTKQIQKVAKMFLSSPEDSWNILKEMNADYVVVFFSAENIGNTNMEIPLYQIGGGGDESKIFWIAQIAELPLQNYLTSDYSFPHTNFYENTMLGKMIPFSPYVYYHPETGENSNIFSPGFVEISSKNIKYDSDTDPVKLVYASPSFTDDDDGRMIFVLVYEVNKNYIP
jgi:dolichyl-diphosphooligosaccharide--protein glycosyltransferase